MPESRKLTLAALATSALAFGLYLPALANGFVNWDDPNYVTANPALGHGGALDYLLWAGSSWYSNNWHPLTWISLGIDHAIFGRESATGYHATSVLLHAANCFLVVRLAAALFARSGASRGARLAAAAGVGVAFAVHPLHVESVAWVSERKDVLYAFFFLASLLAYLRFVDTQAEKRALWYAAALGLFALSILSKPMAVTLPLVLLILDAHPLRRLGGPRQFRVVVLEKLPFLAISLASSWVTIAAQAAGGALTAIELPLPSRLLLAERAVGFYLTKFALPIDLAPLYPMPEQYSLLAAEFWLPLGLCLAITGVAFALARRTPIVLAAWLAFGVLLAPVIGVLQVGNQAAADRYMYLPMLALLMPMGALAMRAWEAGPSARRTLMAGSTGVALLLCVLTFRQIGIWRDTVSLWEHEIALYPDVPTGRHNLGLGYQQAGDLASARAQWETVLELEPGHKWAATDLGNLEKSRGAFRAAEALYRSAIETDPYFAVAHLNLAMTLEEVGRKPEAIEHYRIFVRIAPPQYAQVAAQVRAKLSGY